IEKFCKLVLRQRVHQWMVVAWKETLADQYLLPRDLREQLILLAENLTRSLEQFHAAGERVRDGHAAAVAPELAVVALVEAIVEDDQVPHVLPFHVRLPVVFVYLGLVDAGVREVLYQPDDSGLDHVDARRLERLQEAARKADRHAVTAPLQITPPGTKAQDEWIGERCPVQVPQEQRARLLVAHVRAAVYHAVADPVL